MISKIKKPVSILLALMMVVSLFTIVPMTVSAAPTESLLITINSQGHGDNWGDEFISGSRTFDNIATVTFSDDVYNGDDANGWYYSYEDNRILSVAPAAGYTITKVMFYCKSGSAVDETAPFEANLHDYQMFVNGSSCGQAGVTKIEVYGYATPADPVYALVGTMNEWNTADTTYQLVKNTNTSADEYMLLDFAADANTEFKVVSDGNYIAPTNNFTLNAAGTYDIYFRPDGSGNTADGWVEGKVFANNFRAPATYVAQIGDTKYETLEEAFAAAQDGDTITLLANCAGNGIKAPQGKFATGLTVDFDGHTYTVDGETVGSTGTETNGFQLLKNNTITFKNGTITSAKAKILVQNYSDLTLNNMTLTLNNPNYTGAYTLSNNNGDIVIDGTTINANPAGGFAFDVCRYSSYPSVNVTVKGGSTINGNVEISASNSDAKQGFSLTLESGTMSGEIVVDASAKALVGENNKVTKADDFTQEAPADFKWVADGEGTSKLVAKEYVAQVGTAKYETLDAAIAAAQDGDTVTLLANITLPAQSISGESVQYGAYITKSLTIDGDGHTVTSDAPRAFGVKGTQGDIDVTFKNITVTDKQQGAICVCTRGGINSLTLDNATLSTQGATKGYIQPLTIGGSQATQAKVDVINSTIQTGDAAGKHYAIILWNPVDLTIQNSTIKGWACVYQKAFEDASAGVKTEVTIDNSTLISKGIAGSSNNFATIFTENADFSCDITNTTMDITAAAGTYQAVAASNGSASGFKVELGEGNNVTLTGDTALIGYNFDDENHEIAVSGGTFNTPVAEYYCADGYIPATLDEETGKYSVKTGAYVAQVNGVKYETLEAAFAAASDGDTITLLANCAGNGIKAPQGKFATGLTVDFGGYTYTVDGTTVGSTGTETNGFQLLKDNKITFRNGTITSTKAKILVQNYSDLMLDGMTLTLNNAGYTSAYTLSNNNGDVVINNTTINANPAGGFAFDVCRYASYRSVNVNVTGNSTINGSVEVYASNGDAKDGFSLTLESGTMTGDIVVTNSAKNLINNGGTVNKADAFTKAAPEGFVWVDSATTGVQTLAKAVAKIGTTNYATLEAAFAAAQDGDTITLLADCAGNGIQVLQNRFNTNGLTVDFDGHTYNVDGTTVGSTGTKTQAFQLQKNNKITFKGGTITSTKALMLVQNYSNLTLDGMTLTLNNPNYTGAYTLSNNNGDIVIDGTTINANPAGGFAFDVCRYSSYPSVNVTVKGNSKINGNVEVYASGSNAKDGFSLKLEGGTMTGDIVLDQTAKNVLETAPDKLSVTKAAGFNQAAPEGYVWVDTDTEGVQTIAKAVAKIDTTNYATLEAAFAAAQDGDTITLLADCAGNGIKAPQGKFATGLTVDFDGHTYTVDGTTVGSTGTETQGFQLLKGNKITFENGKITGSSVNTSSLLFLIQNYSDLTLDNMELSLAGKYYNQYTLSNNNGNIVINDSKINAPTYGGVVRHDVNSYAFDVCRYASYPSVNVTVTGNSTINGDVEISASGNDAKDGFSLNLNGGTMTGAIVLDDSAKAAMDATPEKASVNKANTFNQDAPEGYQWVASGEGKQTLAKIVDLFTAHSITLDGNIKLNFYINPEYADFENATSAYVKFSWDDEYTAEVDLKNMVPGEDGYRASVELVAAQMANVVHAEVYLNNAKIGEDDYTVREYAEELYNHPEQYDKKNKPEELRTLAKALLNYGATAQTVFAEDLIDDPEELANATVGYNGYEAVTAEQIGAKIQGTASNMDRVAAQLGGKFYTSSVIYLNKNTLRLYFTPKTYPGSLDYRDQYSGVQSDYYYYVDSQPIPAAELDRQQIFKVGGIEFNYSALDYAKAVIEKNMDTEYQNLAKALFLYNQAAKAYIG